MTLGRRNTTKLSAINRDMFPRVIAYRPALGPTQHPIQWVPGALIARVKQPRSEADHSLPSSPEV